MVYLAYILPVDGGGHRPDNSLPGWQGGFVDPGYGQGHPIGGHPGNRPPGSWGGPVDPGWGGGGTPHPGQGLPGLPPHPGNALPPGPPDVPENTLPGGVHKGQIWIVAYHPGCQVFVGWSLRLSTPLVIRSLVRPPHASGPAGPRPASGAGQPTPPQPSQGLPSTPPDQGGTPSPKKA